MEKERGVVLCILANQIDPKPNTREDSSTPKSEHKGENLEDPTLIKEEVDTLDIDEDNCNSVWKGKYQEFMDVEKVGAHIGQFVLIVLIS